MVFLLPFFGCIKNTCATTVKINTNLNIVNLIFIIQFIFEAVQLIKVNTFGFFFLRCCLCISFLWTRQHNYKKCVLNENIAKDFKFNSSKSTSLNNRKCLCNKWYINAWPNEQSCKRFGQRKSWNVKMATERIFLSGDYKTITYLNDQYYIYKETKIVVVFLYEIKLFVILAFHITMKF